MDRDLRDTPEYRDVEAFFRRAMAPGFGGASDVSDPQPSPDGRWVAFRAEVWTELEGHGHGRIGLAAADGTGWRLITAGPNDDAGPRWSPDGRTLTFASDRAAVGRRQLYALDADAIGEARALPEVPGVVEHHRWSPDGSRILVVAAGELAEQADALGSGTLGEGADVPPWVPEVESSEEIDEWRSAWVIDVGSREVRKVSRDGVNVWEATWLGVDRIVAVVSDAPSEGAWYRAHLATIDVGDGTERVLYRSDVQLSFAEGAPDGRAVAVIEALCSDRYVAAGDLLVIDTDHDAHATRVELPGDASGVRWWDGRLLVFARDGLEAVAYHVDPHAGRSRELWRTSDGVDGHQPGGAPAGDGFAVARSSSTRPPEIVLLRDAGETVVMSTLHEGHEAMAQHLGSTRSLSWTAPDGLEIQGVLWTPPGEGPFPLILSVHGGPVWAIADAWPPVSRSLLLAEGYAILAPNPRGSSGRGRAFAERVVGDMGGADALDLLAGIDAVVSTGVADPNRLAVMGGSYGGFMAAWLPTIDDRFRAAVAISPVTDWYSEHFNSSLIDWVGEFLRATPEEPGGEHHARSPVMAGARLRTPTLLTAGLRDKATPPGQAVEMYRALRARGVPAEVAIYPLEGHGVDSFPAVIDLMTRTLIWLRRHLGG